MANKTVNLVGTKVQASNIADFYNRLNALRSLNGGETTVSFTAPTVGTKVTPQTIQEARDAVLATKSALSFLATIDISGHTPSIPSPGEKVEAKTTAHPIEWQIGQLENACFAFFTTNRITNKTTNYANFDLPNSDECTAFNSTNKSPNYGSHFIAQNKPHRSANYAPVVWASFGSNYGAYFVPIHANICWNDYVPYYNQMNHVVHHSKRGCAHWATQHRPAYKAMFQPFCKAAFTLCDAQYTPNHYNFTTTYTTQFGTQHSTNNGPNFASQNTPVCSANNAAVKTTNNTATNTADNAADFSSVTASFKANHSTFTVSPIE